MRVPQQPLPKGGRPRGLSEHLEEGLLANLKASGFKRDLF